MQIDVKQLKCYNFVSYHFEIFWCLCVCDIERSSIAGKGKAQLVGQGQDPAANTS